MEVVKSSMLKVNAYVIANPHLGFMIEEFLVKHNIPEFTEDRLAIPSKFTGRTKISRAHNIYKDDGLYHTKMAKKEEANVMFRVFAATNE